MSIGALGSAGMPTVANVQRAQEFFKKIDANGDGGIDKAELQAALGNATERSRSAANVDQVFSQADANGDGKIDQAENAKQFEQVGRQVQARMGAKGASGGGGPPGGMGGGSGPASSTDSILYDPRDTNQDGVVSPQEALQYALENSGASRAISSEGTNSSAEATQTQQIVDALMKGIETATQYGQTGAAAVGAGGAASLLDLKV